MTRISARLSALVGLFLVAGLLTDGPASATTSQDFVPGPINAGNTFKWGKMKWREEFEPDVDNPRPVDPYWKVRGNGLVQEQHGMLTLNTTHSGDVTAKLKRHARKYGRWEIRLRSRSFGNGAHYTVRSSLVPVGRKHCGARDIDFETYQTGASQAGFVVRTLPDHAFVSSSPRIDLGDDQWHTFAVEVTRKRISWFVDAAVVTSERRSAALSHARFKVKFTMQAARGAGAGMAISRMQMDWLRYWTLKNKNQKSVAAPSAHATTNAGAC